MFEKTSREALGMSGDGYVYLFDWRHGDDGWEVLAFNHWSEAVEKDSEGKMVGVFVKHTLSSRQQIAAGHNAMRAIAWCKKDFVQTV